MGQGDQGGGHQGGVAIAASRPITVILAQARIQCLIHAAGAVFIQMLRMKEPTGFQPSLE
jgi:hypothetical protein